MMHDQSNGLLSNLTTRDLARLNQKLLILDICFGQPVEDQAQSVDIASRWRLPPTVMVNQDFKTQMQSYDKQFALRYTSTAADVSLLAEDSWPIFHSSMLVAAKRASNFLPTPLPLPRKVAPQIGWRDDKIDEDLQAAEETLNNPLPSQVRFQLVERLKTLQLARDAALRSTRLQTFPRSFSTVLHSHMLSLGNTVGERTHRQLVYP